MYFSFELLLILGVIGFYLYDSAILLFANQIVFVKSYSKWSVCLPTSRWRLMKKILHFPNPLTPFNLIFLSTWSTQDVTDNKSKMDLTKLFGAITYLRISVAALMILLLIALPVSIFKLGMGTVTLVVVFFIYLTIISMLCYAFVKKDDLLLDNRAFMEFAFEALACPPFALNFIRNISLRYPIHSSPVDFATSVLHGDDLNTFIVALDEKLVEELELQDEEDSHRSIEIINYREKLKELFYER